MKSIQEINKTYLDKNLETTPHDVALLDAYKKNPKTLPAHESTEGLAEGTPVLTNYGLMALSLDEDYMQGFYVPRCEELLNTNGELDPLTVRTLRASLIEFAMLGCIEAQQVIDKFLVEYGKSDNDMLASIVLTRWPDRHNLHRFLAIQQGGNDPNVDHTSFHRAMTEIRSGSKRTRWVNYFFPQMKTDRDLPTFYYSLRDETEALIYINHPMLRKRLLKMCEAILQNDHSIFDIFSRFDIKMIRSSIDLFSRISTIKIFEQMRKEYGWKYYKDKF
ncbi:MAG: DUF1810 family protein [Bacteroidales bacterium]|nr:DUF1810 family protein [Bacteroidales bacterium]